MLDVHPPHEPVHGWRDFLLHIVTITIGLLIAIGLEQTVEWMHHRHLVHIAREDIRAEVERNRKAATENLRNVQTNADNMRRNIAIARAFRDHPKSLEHSEMHFDFVWSSFDESAWRSARDTGALAYMPPSEVQRDSDVYAQQEIVNQQAVRIFTHQSEIMAPLLLEADSTALRPEDAHKLMLDSAVASLDLQTLKQLIESLAAQYNNTLDAR